MLHYRLSHDKFLLQEVKLIHRPIALAPEICLRVFPARLSTRRGMPGRRDPVHGELGANGAVLESTWALAYRMVKGSSVKVE
jgi:hypothetical protein